MGLPTTPTIKKFFTNKIESSRPEWGDYLLEIADIFSMFDGEELDRDLLTERFSVISGRSPYALRDVANFRDEFGAYGTYLGVFHFEQSGNSYKICMSKAAKHFLCSTEPDVESFCRTQLSLFQYPNGAGAVQQRNGSIRVQTNAQNDTLREVANNIRLNPLRLLCRAVVALHDLGHTPLDDIFLSYQTIFMLFNDDAVNTNFSPSLESIYATLQEYEETPPPAWAVSGQALTNFKRNFHIMTRTGIFSREMTGGLSLIAADLERSYQLAKEIAQMQYDFLAFEECYETANVNDVVTAVISSSKWGKYYDALSLPMDTLAALSDNIDISNAEFYTPPIGTIEVVEQPFPVLQTFRSDQIRAFTPSGNRTNPYETIIRREKANREHARILNMLAALIRLKGHEVYENTFIDLYTNSPDRSYIFEVKSNNSRNTLSQIRKAIAQLYEYRYRSGMNDAILCIVLQEKPLQNWVEDYLLHDRNILMCWLVDDVRLECPDECRDVLENIGVVE